MKNGLVRRDFLSPFSDFNPWFKNVDDVFDRFLVPVKARESYFNPACEVEEDDNQYLFSFDVPGVAKEDVKIELVDNELIVSGERKSVTKEKKQNWHLMERSFGSFRRSFKLPTNVDADKIEAAYVDGVLKISVPKSEAVKPREIKISAN